MRLYNLKLQLNEIVIFLTGDTNIKLIGELKESSKQRENYSIDHILVVIYLTNLNKMLF